MTERSASPRSRVVRRRRPGRDTPSALSVAPGVRRRRPGRDTPSPLYVVPALAFFVAFALIPLVGVIVLSLAEWNGLSDPTWAGLENWRDALAREQTYDGIVLSLKFMALSWIVQTPVSLLLGVFLAGRSRYRAVMSVLMFLPLLLSAAAIAIAYKALLDPNFGAGSSLGIDVLVQNWLGSPDLAFYVVVFVVAWQFVPFHTLLYQAATRQIPASMYEAATLDGAGRVSQFLHITLPQLRNTLVTSSTLMVVGSLTYFDIVFVLTGGGPGTATRLLPLDMYLSGFSSNDMGLGSVLAVLLVLLGLGIALALTKFTGFNRMRSDLEGA